MSYFFIPGLEREIYAERLQEAERRRQIAAIRSSQPATAQRIRTWLGDKLIASGSILKGQSRSNQTGTFVPQRVRFSRQGR